MMNFSTARKAWAMLSSRERRNAGLVLGVMMLAALSAAAMVGSIMPFLAVLADPSRIETTPVLAWAYVQFGFRSVHQFMIGLGLSTFAVIVLASGIQIIRTWAVARYSLMRSHTLGFSLLACYLAQPYPFFLNRHTGDMGPRVLAEADQVVSRFLRPVADLVAAGLTIIAIVGLLLWVDPVIAVLAFLVLGGIYSVVYVLTRRTLSQLGQVRVENNRLRHRFANEALTGIKDIKLVGREKAYLDRFALPSERLFRNEVRVNVISQVPQFALQAIALGGVILLCVVLTDQQPAQASAGLGGLLPTLGLFAFAGQRLMPELSKFFSSLAFMQVGKASVDAVHDDMIGLDKGEPLPNMPPEAMGFKNTLALVGVSYTYPRSEKAGLHEISVLIRAGEKIGIVGTTGAGKTTLADIILGLLEPEQGQLVVDGTVIGPGNQRAWRQSVGYVPQDIFLTDAPVAENIALGVMPEQIDPERLRRAARIARIDEFISERLAEGYQTHVGERGVRLSGGQRQRIGIARALYHDADLIVFDEATSALDNLTEKDVMAAIDALPGDKTVMMIAHRLTTVRRCDRIIVLDQGRLVGCDTWDALMDGNEAFRRIAIEQ